MADMHELRFAPTINVITSEFIIRAIKIREIAV